MRSFENDPKTKDPFSTYSNVRPRLQDPKMRGINPVELVEKGQQRSNFRTRQMYSMESIVGVNGFLLPTRTTITPTSAQRLLLSSTTAQQQRLSSSYLFMVIDEESSESSSSNYSQDTDNNIINKAIEKLILKHDPILLFVSKLLTNNNNIRNDALALYAWCRRLDEICDNEDNNKHDPNLVKNQLDRWQTRFNLIWETSTSTTTTSAAANTTTTTPNDDDDDDDDDEYLMDLALINCIKRYTYTSSNNEDDSNYDSYLLTRQPFDDMINGMKSDIVVQQEQRLPRIIQTMEELETYAYQVAGTVGTMLLPLLFSISSTSASTSSNSNDRNQNEDENQNQDQNHNKRMSEIGQKIDMAKEPAICLGKAIQLVNILRDAKQDAKLGRIYLPQDLLDQYCNVYNNNNNTNETNNNNNNNEILELALETKSGGGGRGEGGALDGYRTVVQIVSLRAYELLNEAEIGSKATLPSNPFVIQLFVQIIIELYKDYLDELQYNRHYDNICYTTNKNSNTSNNREDNDGRVKISKVRKVQATFRAVIKIVFN
ncbi:Phytoene synthase [Fragilariopsis cylindrus CCMP1102]|uniref:15-cis-phytoene synthase n=1 Tax=Fragilariopsis cylindrus CCMP1102 TaxID=635003 RepID=A0A1E7FZV3_9STRA|nr:Phytoene synthase [Fragilariopsis cylindrus CCMP1102]|eukprot:OEU23686.1 Phytoene synthase [Fragilariopsis cylindrus CCMP1102]